MERRDKRGRRIGYNWWRASIMSSWASAHHAWSLAREAIAVERSEYDEQNPQPTLKAFMIGLAFKSFYTEKSPEEDIYE